MTRFGGAHPPKNPQPPNAASLLPQNSLKVVGWHASKSDCDKFVPVSIGILGKIFFKNIFKNILFLIKKGYKVAMAPLRGAHDDGRASSQAFFRSI